MMVKIEKILNALLCLVVKLIKDKGREFAGIRMLRANNCFGVDVRIQTLQKSLL